MPTQSRSCASLCRVCCRADQIKEYLLGVEVFDREASYNPQIDPIVRVEAGRVRSKLKQYYETEGRQDPVVIEFPSEAMCRCSRCGMPRPSEAQAQSSREDDAAPRAKERAVWRSKLLPVVLVLAFGIAWWWRRSLTPNQGPILTRLTWHSGLTTDPAISRMENFWPMPPIAAEREILISGFSRSQAVNPSG